MKPKLTSGSSAPPELGAAGVVDAGVGEAGGPAVVGDRRADAEVLGDPGVGVAVVLLDRLQGRAGRRRAGRRRWRGPRGSSGSCASYGAVISSRMAPKSPSVTWLPAYRPMLCASLPARPTCVAQPLRSDSSTASSAVIVDPPCWCCGYVVVHINVSAMASATITANTVNQVRGMGHLLPTANQGKTIPVIPTTRPRTIGRSPGQEPGHRHDEREEHRTVDRRVAGEALEAGRRRPWPCRPRGALPGPGASWRHRTSWPRSPNRSAAARI